VGIEGKGRGQGHMQGEEKGWGGWRGVVDFL